MLHVAKMHSTFVQRQEAMESIHVPCDGVRSTQCYLMLLALSEAVHELSPFL